MKTETKKPKSNDSADNELATVDAQPALKETVLNAQQQIQEVLPTGTDRLRFLRVALMVLSDRNFSDCTNLSKLECIMDAARLGLDFAPSLGEAYPVPFGKQVVMLPGYRGLQKLARNTDQIEIEARCVFEDDHFEWWEGTDPKIDHKPSITEHREDDNITHAYAIATFPDSRKDKFVVMDRAEIEIVRSMSKAKNSLMWTKRWREGARKTVVRNMCKYLPMSADSPLARGVEAADREFDMARGELPDMTEGKHEFGFRVADQVTTPNPEPEEDKHGNVITGTDDGTAIAIGAQAEVDKGGNVIHEPDEGVTAPRIVHDEPKRVVDEPIEDIKARGEVPIMQTTEPEPASEPNKADLRFAQLIEHVAQNGELTLDRAEKVALRWLKRFYPKTSMAFQDQRFDTLIWPKAKKVDWKKEAAA